MRSIIKVAGAVLGVAAVSVVGLALIGSREPDEEYIEDDIFDADFKELDESEDRKDDENDETPEEDNSEEK